MASDTFNSLPGYLQQRIDRAFDSETLVQSVQHYSNSRPGVGSGGGFLVEDDMLQAEKQTAIPMLSIPSALQRLNLPPDDDEVLAVFRNAASGWTSAKSSIVHENNIGGDMISQNDWRSVCAVLLEHHEDEDDGQEGLSEESGDQYLEHESSNDSDNEYVGGRVASSSLHRAHGRQSLSLLSSVDPPSRQKRLTTRQRQATLDAFSLFFPLITASEVPNQRIMIKDIQRISKLLGEKIKADEIVEMLDAFSTSPDKSIGLADFEHIMVATGLL